VSEARNIVRNGLDNIGFPQIKDLIRLPEVTTALTADSTLVTADDITHTADEE